MLSFRSEITSTWCLFARRPDGQLVKVVQVFTEENTRTMRETGLFFSHDQTKARILELGISLNPHILSVEWQTPMS
jgi:hypothetical protein